MAVLGILTALDLEMETLRSRLAGGVSERAGGFSFLRGELFGREVVLAVCGVGKVAAAICAQTMILRYAPGALLNVGVAGGCVPSLSVGDIALARDVVQVDFDTSALGDPPGLVAGMPSVALPCSDRLTLALRGALRSLGLRFMEGTLASSDRFLTEEGKRDAAARFGAIACEMEGGGVAQTCLLAGVPFALLRAISDGVGGGGDDYERFKHIAAARTAAILEAALPQM